MNTPNFHILTVKYVGATNFLGSRVKIISERFKQSITFGYQHEYNNTLDQAKAWLTAHGFEVIGQAEGKDHYYVISTTFEPIKPIK